MYMILFLIWYMIAILPMFILMEGTARLSKFLKHRGIYAYWDMWHSVLVILIIITFILYIRGYR